MKFTMFEKETKDEKYRNNSYKSINSKYNAKGELICSNNHKIYFKYEKHIKGNNYGRAEEILCLYLLYLKIKKIF